jgi:hypothetical protein
MFPFAGPFPGGGGVAACGAPDEPASTDAFTSLKRKASAREEKTVAGMTGTTLAAVWPPAPGRTPAAAACSACILVISGMPNAALSPGTFSKSICAAERHRV